MSLSDSPPRPLHAVEAELKTMREGLEKKFDRDPWVAKAQLEAEKRDGAIARGGTDVTNIQLQTWRSRTEGRLSPETRKELEERRAENEKALAESIRKADAERLAAREARLALRRRRK